MYNDRIVIPSSLRYQILESLHAAHQCTGMMCSRAKSTVFWPGISMSIQQQRNNCNACNRNAPSQQSAPPYPIPTPEYPFELLCADLISFNTKVLTIWWQWTDTQTGRSSNVLEKGRKAQLIPYVDNSLPTGFLMSCHLMGDLSSRQVPPQHFKRTGESSNMCPSHIQIAGQRSVSRPLRG